VAELATRYQSPQPDLRKKQPQERTSRAFRSWPEADAPCEREIERLRAKIGQLMAERDLYERPIVKALTHFYPSNCSVRKIAGRPASLCPRG
jgi:hypothetical protein